MIGNKNRIKLNQRWEPSSLQLSETVKLGVLGGVCQPTFLQTRFVTLPVFSATYCVCQNK